MLGQKGTGSKALGARKRQFAAVTRPIAGRSHAIADLFHFDGGGVGLASRDTEMTAIGAGGVAHAVPGAHAAPARDQRIDLAVESQQLRALG
jgi:hypothetical protein